MNNYRAVCKLRKIGLVEGIRILSKNNFELVLEKYENLYWGEVAVGTKYKLRYV